MDPVLVRELYQVHDRFCRSFADPKRLLIMSALADGERCVGDIARELDLRQANVSQHLALLRDRGIVQHRREGATVYYSLTNPKFLAALALLREILRERTGAASAPAPSSASQAAGPPASDGEGRTNAVKSY